MYTVASVLIYQFHCFISIKTRSILPSLKFMNTFDEALCCAQKFSQVLSLSDGFLSSSAVFVSAFCPVQMGAILKPSTFLHPKHKMLNPRKPKGFCVCTAAPSFVENAVCKLRLPLPWRLMRAQTFLLQFL